MDIPWTMLARTILPVVLSVIPGLPAVFIPSVVALILQVEATVKPGAEKKAEVLKTIGAAIDVIHATGKTDGTPSRETVLSAISVGIDAGVQAVNTIREIADSRPTDAPKPA